MSCITLFIVDSDGDVKEHTKYSNAFQGSLYVWLALAKKYIKKPTDEENFFVGNLLLNNMKSVWALATDERVTDFEKATLMSTFDKVVCKKDSLLKLAEAFELFVKEHPGPNNYTKQAEDLKKLAEADILGVCWQQTSVAQNHWLKDNEESYNINKDKDHWILFEES